MLNALCALVGGSTDLQAFIDKYECGSVINFPSTLYTYITIHDNHTDNYIINYSKKEVVDKAADIKNDVARETLVYFDVGPVTVTFNTDILSEGSGLAASSSYMIAIVKAVSLYKGINLESDFEICRIALELERHFNPLTGYQDSYGSGIESIFLVPLLQQRNAYRDDPALLLMMFQCRHVGTRVPSPFVRLLGRGPLN